MKVPFRRKKNDPSRPLQLEGVRKGSVETGRARLVVTAAMFVLAFSLIAGRMVDVSIFKGSGGQRTRMSSTGDDVMRADVIDRNGVLLATSLPSASLYARPKEIQDPGTTAKAVVSVLPNLHVAEIEAKLRSEKGFSYLMRNLTPRQEYDVNALGIPGLYFEHGEKRVYPQGDLAAHVVGLTDLDGKGVAGIEKKFDKQLASRHEPLRLSLDIRVQTVLHDELAKAMSDFSAAGAMGMVMDVQNGELLGMVSLPDFDPNNMSTATPNAMFDRATLGVYEMGSTFKLFTASAALDSGSATINSTFDASKPIKVARFTINDYEHMNRALSIPEILIYSSNIGAAKMALQMGIDTQKKYLQRFHLFQPASIEVPEVGAPLFPQTWHDINSMTIAFGHGMAISPLQEVTGVSAIVNGGVFHTPTLLKRDADEPIPSERVIKPETSAAMRQMMRLVVTEGTGSKADVPGYEVGGKTGTAEKASAHGYKKKLNLSSFIATFPVSHPRYVVLAMVDEPHGTKQTFGFTTGGWIGAPAVGHIISQIGPMLDMTPLAPSDVVADKAHLAQNVAVDAASIRRLALAATE